MILKGIISFVLSVVLNVAIDYFIWNKQINKPENKRNHVTGAIIKTVSILPAFYYFSSASNLKWVWNIGVTGFMLWFCFILFFDGCYNIARREPFFWRGSVEKTNQAKLDDFWQSIKKEGAYITIKLLLPAIFIFLYYKGLQK